MKSFSSAVEEKGRKQKDSVKDSRPSKTPSLIFSQKARILLPGQETNATSMVTIPQHSESISLREQTCAEPCFHLAHKPQKNVSDECKPRGLPDHGATAPP